VANKYISLQALEDLVEARPDTRVNDQHSGELIASTLRAHRDSELISSSNDVK